MFNISKKGFSLVELIIVVTILGTLTLIGIITYLDQLTKARDSERIRDLKRLENVTVQYFSDKMEYPEVSDLNKLLEYEKVSLRDISNKDEFIYTYAVGPFNNKKRQQFEYSCSFENSENFDKLKVEYDGGNDNFRYEVGFLENNINLKNKKLDFERQDIREGKDQVNNLDTSIPEYKKEDLNQLKSGESVNNKKGYINISNSKEQSNIIVLKGIISNGLKYTNIDNFPYDDNNIEKKEINISKEEEKIINESISVQLSRKEEICKAYVLNTINTSTKENNIIYKNKYKVEYDPSENQCILSLNKDNSIRIDFDKTKQ